MSDSEGINSLHTEKTDGEAAPHGQPHPRHHARCLVVGGAGYLGGRVVDLAVKASHDVRVYDSLLYDHTYLRTDVDFFYGDVRDTDRLTRHLAWADVVIWLAGIVGDGACALNPLAATEVNYESLARARDIYRGRLIFTSSCSVYGAQDGLLTERSPTKPLSLYATTKLAAEKRLLANNTDTLIYRLATLHGIGGRIRLDLVVNTLTARAVTDGVMRVFGGGQYRPHLHVTDAAKAIVAEATSTRRGIVNLATENRRISDVAKAVCTLIPDARIEIIDTTVEDTRNYQVTSHRSPQTEFGVPLHIEDGIQEIRDLIVSGRVRDPSNPRWTNNGFLLGLGRRP